MALAMAAPIDASIDSEITNQLTMWESTGSVQILQTLKARSDWLAMQDTHNWLFPLMRIKHQAAFVD